MENDSQLPPSRSVGSRFGGKGTSILKGTSVEAIEEGKIVTVTEDYARREGLPIVRKIHSSKEDSSEKLDLGDKEVVDFRRSLSWKKNRVLGDLIDHFHWEISKRRREMNLTRGRLAEMIGEKEGVIKELENGILHRDDFILINKVQDCLGINLRKDKKDFGQNMRKLVESQTLNEDLIGTDKGEVELFEDFDDGKISGRDIEVIEED